MKLVNRKSARKVTLVVWAKAFEISTIIGLSKCYFLAKLFL